MPQGNDDPRPADAPPPVEGELPLATSAELESRVEGNKEKEAHRRRYRVLKTLLDQGVVTVESLLKNRNFRRAFVHTAKTTLETDFREIVGLFGEAVSVERKAGNELWLRRHGDSPFAAYNYGKNPQLTSQDAVDAQIKDVEAKRRIGDYIVSHLLTNPNEIVYLSTGTTVYQIAKALVDTPMDNIRVILTDNLAILYLLFQKALTKSWPANFSLELLGGKADFSRGDIAPLHVRLLEEWECSTAIISATAVSTVTGRIYSFRQPETKMKVLEHMKIGRVVIPVMPEKFEVIGGRLVHDPSARDPKQDRVYHIVTTRLAAKHRTALLQEHYEIHEADDQAGG